ncbi:hypothetical protein SGM_1844 [Streptomyces griseoaurantiacus M045]|uniref:Uncharacterized protein n=1 Tax=Streptomyces griseoaurantiacus M045 TaxID=996637 RepID=F3NFE5_9ACTN|nr:hypothetical protein SGM_1844 [Streptomyces griseoaurantiacus M045]
MAASASAGSGTAPSFGALSWKSPDPGVPAESWVAEAGLSAASFPA